MTTTTGVSSSSSSSSGSSDDFDTYLRYKRPPGFKFEFPSDKKFVWFQQGNGPDRHYEVAEVLQQNTDKVLRVRLKDSTQEIEVDEIETEGVNPAKFDGVDDCAMLSYLSQASVLHNLRLRYDANIVYTYSGLFLVSVNPYAWYPIYTQDVINRYVNKRRSEVPPHIYAIADEAYRHLLIDKKCQSMLVTGESGAGKTENTKKIIQYLAAVGGRNTTADDSLEQKIIQANPLLEALGNAKTLKNNNSSRFGKFIKIHFDSATGLISGSSICPYLLEHSRVVSRGLEERSFHIFYQLLAALPATQKAQYRLTEPTDYHYLTSSGTNFIADGIDDVREFAATQEALNVLCFSREEQDTIIRVIAGILHLGNVRFEGDEQASIVDDEPLQLASLNLRVDPKVLKNALVSPRITVGKEKIAKRLTPWQAERSRDALAKAVYGRMFLWVVKKINDTLNVRVKDMFIGILDIAGFEIFPYNSFEQLCINFTNERLQQFFNVHMFHLEQEEYKKEQIEWTFVDFGVDSQATIDLIKKKPKGIMILLDEESVFPKATDASFVDKIDKAHNHRHPKFRREQTDKLTVFAIEHYAGKVEYDATLWLEKNTDPLQDDLKLAIKGSKDPCLVQLWDLSEAVQPKGPAGGTGASFGTVGAIYRTQLDDLMDTLGATYPHFIRCIIPNHKKTRGYLDNAIVLDQLACNGVLEGIKISRMGFPNRMKYADFLKRYYIIIPGTTSKATDPKLATSKIIEKLTRDSAIDPERVRFGLTKIFFRTGEMAKIEEMREKIVGSMIGEIQALARGYIARKIYERMRQRTEASLVIQKNVRAWLELRESGWWRLMKKIMSPEYQRMAQREKLEREAREKVEKVVAELEMVKKEKEQLNTVIEKLNSDTEVMQMELQRQRERYEEMQKEIAAVYDDCKKHDVEKEKFLEQLNDKEKELKRTKDEATAIQNEAKLIELKISDIQNDCSRINDSINLDRVEIGRVQSAIEQQKDAVKAQQLSIKGLEEQMDLKHDNIRLLIERKTASMREKIDLETQHHADQQKKKDLQTDLSKLEKALDAVNLDLRNIRPVLEQNAKRRKDVQAVVKSSENEQQSLQHQLEEQESLALRFKNDHKNLSTESERLSFNLNSEKKDVKDLSDNLQKQTLELQTLKEKLVQSQSLKMASELQKEKVGKKIAELKPNLADALLKVEKLMKEISGLQVECEDMERLNGEIQGQIGKMERAIEKMSVVREERKEKEKEIKVAKSKCDKQKEKVDQKMNELKKTFDENKAKKTKLTNDQQRINEDKLKLTEDVEQVRQEKVGALKVNDKLNQSIKELELEKSNVAAATTTTAKKHVQWSKQRDEMKQVKEELVSRKHALTTARDLMTAQIASLQTKLTEQSELRKRIGGRIKQAEQDTQTIQEQFTTLDKENSSMLKKCTQFEQQEKERRTEIHGIEDSIHELQKKETKLESELKDEQRTIADKEAIIDQLEKAIKLKADDVEQIMFKLSLERENNNTLEKENKEIEENLENLKTKLEKEKQLKLRSRGLIVELLEEIDDKKQKQLEALNHSKLDAQQRALSSSLSSLRVELERENDAKNASLLDASKLADDKQRLQEQVAEVRAKREALEREKKNVAYKMQMVEKELTATLTAKEQLELRVGALERKAAKCRGVNEVKTKKPLSQQQQEQEQQKRQKRRRGRKSKETVAEEAGAGAMKEGEGEGEKEEKEKKEEEESGDESESESDEGEARRRPAAPATTTTGAAPTPAPVLSTDEQLRSLKDQMRRYMNDIKNESRAFSHLDRQGCSHEAEVAHLVQSLHDARNANVHLRRQGDALEEDVDLLKGSLQADQEVMQLYRQLLAEQNKETEQVKEKLQSLYKDRDAIHERTAVLKKELLLLKDELERERHMAQSALANKHKNNTRLTMAQTDERMGGGVITVATTTAAAAAALAGVGGASGAGAVAAGVVVVDRREASNVALRRETLRYLKIIKKLHVQYKTSAAEKEEQEKITWQLQDEVDRLKAEVHDIALARAIAERERDALQKHHSGAEQFARDLTAANERSKRIASELQRESDLIKDHSASLEEKNSQLQHYKDKHRNAAQELEQQLQFAQQRHLVEHEEKVQVELERRRLRRLVTDEQEGHRLASETLDRAEAQLAQARDELSLRRAQLTQAEREYEVLTQEALETRTALEEGLRTGLTEAERVRLEKQYEGYKRQIEEEKRRADQVRLAVSELEDEIEKRKFDVKTLNNDINRIRMEEKRTRKVVTELRAMVEKRRDDEEQEGVVEEEAALLSDDEEEEEEWNRKRGERRKKKAPGGKGERKKKTKRGGEEETPRAGRAVNVR